MLTATNGPSARSECLVDGMGEQFLARARFPQDQRRAIAQGKAADLDLSSLTPSLGADKAGQRIFRLPLPASSAACARVQLLLQRFELFRIGCR